MQTLLEPDQADLGLELDDPVLKSVFFHVSVENSKKKHRLVSERAREMIAALSNHVPYSCMQFSYDVLVVPGRVGELPDGPKTLRFWRREVGEAAGLLTLPVEAMFLFWKHLIPRTLEKIGVRHIVGMHEPIPDGIGIPRLFEVGLYGNKFRLGTVSALPDGLLPPDDYAYLFMVPKSLSLNFRMEYSITY